MVVGQRARNFVIKAEFRFQGNESGEKGGEMAPKILCL
jgi:hypothetical protein